MRFADSRPDRVACFGYAHVPAMYPHERALGSTTYPTLRSVSRSSASPSSA